jgi:hypothetical protein
MWVRAATLSTRPISIFEELPLIFASSKATMLIIIFWLDEMNRSSGKDGANYN